MGESATFRDLQVAYVLGTIRKVKAYASLILIRETRAYKAASCLLIDKSLPAAAA
jgi:hypothetical protein